MQGKQGTVWTTGDKSSQFAISVAGDGDCTIYLCKADTAELTAALELWLPPGESKVTVERKPLGASKGMNVTEYAFRVNDKLLQSWVLAVSQSPGVILQGIVSIRSAHP